MSKLRIAVIGVGLGGKTHIRLMESSTSAVLVSIVAPDNVKNHAYAQQHNVPMYFTIEECLKSRAVDGVIIASPNQLHYQQAEVCINHGVPVLIEKPVTSTVHEGNSLLQLVESNNAKVLVGHHRAHNPILKAAGQVVRSGSLGKLVSFMGSAQFYKPAHYYDDGPWRKVIGGGPILINMIHEIDNMRRLMGDIVAVHAITSNSIRKFVVEDTVAINLVFANGALGTFILSDTSAIAMSWEQTSGENPGYPSYRDEDCYFIAGTRGSLAIPTMRMKYYADDITPSWWNTFTEEQINVSTLDPLAIQLEHFMDVIRDNVAPLVTVEDGYRNLLVTEAIRKSATTKSIVEV